MHPGHVKYTGFMTPDGKHEWLRMPFGLKNASSTFQRLMDHVVGQTVHSSVYPDDIFNYSHTWQEHVQHLKTTFEKLAVHEVKLKLPKSIFGASCEFLIKALGHIVGEE